MKNLIFSWWLFSWWVPFLSLNEHLRSWKVVWKMETNTLGPIKKVTVRRVTSKLPPPKSATEPNVYLPIVTSMRKQYETIGAELINYPFWHGWCNCVIICHNSLLKLSEQTSSLPSSSVPMETGTERSAIPRDLVYSSGYRGFISFDR